MADDGSYPSLHTMSGSADNTEKKPATSRDSFILLS